MFAKGVDLSYHNRGVSFDKLKEQGYEFVILRVGIRGWKYPTINKDTCFEEFYKEARRVGLDVGCYFFTQAINEAEAIEEAKWVVETIKDKVFEYPIYIDQEWANNAHNGRADYNTTETNTNVCKAFCSYIEKAGYYAGIYLSHDWLKHKVLWKELEQYDKWIAKWSVFKPDKLRGSYGMWQNTNNLNIGGKRIDGNISYYNYPQIMLDNGLNNVTKPDSRFELIINNVPKSYCEYLEAFCKENYITYIIKEVK